MLYTVSVLPLFEPGLVMDVGDLKVIFSLVSGLSRSAVMFHDSRNEMKNTHMNTDE